MRWLRFVAVRSKNDIGTASVVDPDPQGPETERRGGRIGEKSVMLLLPKNRPVQHTFEI
jgi:hypothetical protein